MRHLRSLAALAAVLVSCQSELSDLTPFPCAEDGTCPDGLACVAGSCETAKLDSPCVKGDTDCSGAGAGAVCLAGVCTTSCLDGAGCPAGRVCTAAAGPGACVADCTSTGTCAAGLECADVWRDGLRGCVGDSELVRACVDVEPTTECTNCGLEYFQVACPAGGYCPLNSTCTADGCECNAGFAATTCAGASCTSGCAAPDYWCKPVASVTAYCGDTPPTSAGSCVCKDGRIVPQTCGATESCEWKCGLGCDPLDQTTCTFADRTKCTLRVDDAGAVRTECVAPAGAGAPGDPCTRSAFGLDSCAGGSFCTALGDLTSTCHPLCRSSTACVAGAACFDLSGLRPKVGVCLPSTCAFFGGDCPSGLACDAAWTVEETSRTYCRVWGTKTAGTACTVDTECGPLTTCLAGTCHALCEPAHPCEAAGQVCTPIDGLSGGQGICE